MNLVRKIESSPPSDVISEELDLLLKRTQQGLVVLEQVCVCRGHLPICLSACLAICMYVCVSVWLSLSLCVSLCVCLSLRGSAYVYLIKFCTYICTYVTYVCMYDCCC